MTESVWDNGRIGKAKEDSELAFPPQILGFSGIWEASHLPEMHPRDLF